MSRKTERIAALEQTFGQCIVCGWTGRPACSECGEPVPVDSECCSACGAWENALEADTHTAGDVLTKAMRLTTRMDELDERKTR